MEFVQKRCSEVKIQKRADVNVMCSWVVTAPKDLWDREIEKFMHVTHMFLAERYGKENIISAYVHMDETTPHVHFAFVPVVKDKKKNILKVSAKELIGLGELNRFHKDLSAYMEGVFGRDIGIMNEATKEGNKSTKELKEGTAQRELEEITSQTEEMQKKSAEIAQEIEKRTKALESLQEQETSLQSKIEGLKEDIKQEQKDFKDIQKKFKPRKDDLERVNKLARQVKPPILSNRVNLLKEDWDFIINIASQHARISDATLAALEKHEKDTEKLERCQRLYLALASEVGAITHAGDREKLRHAVEDVLKDAEHWSVAFLMDDIKNHNPSSLDEILEMRKRKISKKYSFAKENREYNQPSVPKKEKKRSNSHDDR